MNKSEAIKATKNGAIAACVSAAITIIFILIAMNSDAEGMLVLWSDPSNFIDVVLILACAFGMYKKSRAASVIIVFYFIAAKVIIFVEAPAFNGIAVGLVILYFYCKAIQGSFVYHKLEKEENPDYKITSKWAYILGIPSLILVVSLFGFAVMSTTGVIPSTRVQTGSELKTSEITILRSRGIISIEDNINYFYSQGMISILESGNVLTQDRVILYMIDENDALQVYEIPLNEITDVVLESEGDVVNDSVYKVTTKDPERWIKLFLSVEQKGDQKFVQALRNKISI